ncbi:DUF4199 domain-containing protein [Parapedobacter sp. 2B3]|uniref:DUF4199 domain-containing protein n=1 Tax=Parapedobacter sp. 2B3 TaxID=3342381 RepID=UPI0035B5CDF4
MLNAIRYGILFALAIFLWAVAETVLGLHNRYIQYHEYLSYFFAVPSVGIMYWGIRASGSTQGHGMRFRKAFVTGLGITAVVTLLCPVVWYVFCTFVNPMFLDNMARHATETKSMPPLLATQRYALSNYIYISAFSTAVIGSIISLVIAVIMDGRRR